MREIASKAGINPPQWAPDVSSQPKRQQKPAQAKYRASIGKLIELYPFWTMVLFEVSQKKSDANIL